MAVNLEIAVKIGGFGTDFLHFAAGFCVFFRDEIGVKLFADEFEFVIEFLGEFEKHEATPKDNGVGGVAIGIGVCFLDGGVGLDEFGGSISGDSEVV